MIRGSAALLAAAAALIVGLLAAPLGAGASPRASTLDRPGFTITTIDPAGRVPSMEIGADGLALISYGASEKLKVAHCQNIGCTRAKSSVVDAGALVESTSIAIGSDGLGLISYVTTTGALKVAHCLNLPCSEATKATIATGSGPPSIVIGADGLGLISYRNAGELVNVAHCTDSACSTASTATISGGWGAGPPSITVVGDGLGLIVYPHELLGGMTVEVAHCVDATCSSATIASVGTGVIRYYSAVTTGSDGLALFPIVGAEGGLDIAHCSNPDCSSVNGIRTSATFVNGVSMTVGADGLALAAVPRDGDPYPYGVSVVHCRDIACTSTTTAWVVPGFGAQGPVPIAVGVDDFPILAYVRGGLEVAHCSNPSCASPPTS